MTDYIIVLLGGFFAGAINSLAGYGSIITLTILMDIVGLSPNVANGTNRVNVMANAFAGSLGYYRQGKMRLNRVWLIVFLVLIGAITGVYVATIISNEGFRNLYRVLVFLLAILILTKPKNWLIKESSQEKLNLWIAYSGVCFDWFLCRTNTSWFRTFYARGSCSTCKEGTVGSQCDQDVHYLILLGDCHRHLSLQRSY